MSNNIPKLAVCIRNTSSWGHVKPEFKFDSNKFNKSSVLKNLPLMSPKIHALLEKIKALDEEDMRRDGKYYKHIIYSDVDGTNGAKMVASSMIANDYTLIYNNGIIKKNINDDYKTFGLLTKSTVNKKPLPVKLKKNMMNIMNNRENNVNGKDMRFIILDSGFKEGIDVFDVKYMHLLEPLITAAEKTQVIGRGTRYCGQAGLPFIPNDGWPLHVYTYNIKYNDDMTVHDLFRKHSNENVSVFNFIADMEDILMASAVDLPLNENLHIMSLNNNRFYNYIKDIIRRDNHLIQISNNGINYRNDVDKIDCKNNCKGILSAKADNFNPIEILLTAALHIVKINYVKRLPKINKSDSNDNKSWEGAIIKKITFDENDTKVIKAFNKKSPYETLCGFISSRDDYCDTVNEIWKNSNAFINKHGSILLDKLEELFKYKKININNYKDIYRFIKETNKKHKATEKPPAKKLDYIELYNYIIKNYKNYIWDIPQIKNKCIDQPIEEKKSKEEENDDKIVSFTNTQMFVQKYLTPQSPYKGLFLYHSVGSGKTCTAIATATNTFNKEGYTIIWVTRYTLKEDIWKNMFVKICNIIIRDKLKSGEIKEIPNTHLKRIELLGANWIQPISYKQFTNMIKGKNKLYDMMVKRNGTTDPFKKTLIIVDEIHKIYSNTLSNMEKPNPEVLQKMIQNSYAVSGKDSLRLLLMTATPFTNDPMSSIKILNLLLEKDKQMPEDFTLFKELYCTQNGIIDNHKIMDFMNNIAGLISYIDTRGDRSKFAYPVAMDVICNIDVNYKNMGSSLNNIEENMNIIMAKLSNDKEMLGKEEIKTLKAELKKLEKDKKAVINKLKEPKSILDYINKCFAEKK
jgi:superfamily II DNA or RNA helicase